MLTGRVAFAGETVSDTIGKILEREPDWSALPRTTPAVDSTTRCAAASRRIPRQRLRDIGDVRIEIDAIDEALPGRSDVTIAHRQPADPHDVAAVGRAASLRARASASWEARRPATAGRTRSPTPSSRASRTGRARKRAPKSRPTGSSWPFVADRAGEFDVWLSQVGTGSLSQSDGATFPRLATSGSTCCGSPGFSGDGSEIWFNPTTEPPIAQMIVPLMRRHAAGHFLDKGANAPAWSPDSTRLAYISSTENG